MDPALPGDCLRLANQYLSQTVQALWDCCFCAGSWDEWVCVQAFLEWYLSTLQPLGLLDIIPLFFKAMFGGFVSPVQVSRVGMPAVGPGTVTLQGEGPALGDSSCGIPHLEWVFWWEHISASPTCFNGTLLSFVVEEQFSWFSGLFQRRSFHI